MSLNYYTFIKSGQSITEVICCNQLDRIIKNVAEKQPRLVNRDRPILIHDNACPHTANRTQLKKLQLDLETIDHLPYSPDLSPNDYQLVRNFDCFLRGKILNSQQAIEIAFLTFIGFRSPGFYAKGINKLQLI